MNKKITLSRSLIGSKPHQKLVAQSLGLRRIGDSIVCKADAVLNGKIAKIAHLVTVEDAAE